MVAVGLILAVIIVIPNVICAALAFDQERRSGIRGEPNRYQQPIPWWEPLALLLAWNLIGTLVAPLLVPPAAVTADLLLAVALLGPFAPILAALPVGWAVARLRPYREPELSASHEGERSAAVIVGEFVEAEWWEEMAA